nr:MAG TPA: hypothetical protein [Caudoviricetes sp.]
MKFVFRFCRWQRLKNLNLIYFYYRDLYKNLNF